MEKRVWVTMFVLLLALGVMIFTGCAPEEQDNEQPGEQTAQGDGSYVF